MPSEGNGIFARPTSSTGMCNTRDAHYPTLKHGKWNPRSNIQTKKQRKTNIQTLKHCLLPKQRPNAAPPTPSMACLLPMQRPTSGHSGASGAAAAAAEAGVAAGAMFCAAAARCRHPEGSSCCAFLPLLLSSWTCAVLGTNNSMVSSSTHTQDPDAVSKEPHTQDPDAIARRLSQS